MGASCSAATVKESNKSNILKTKSVLGAKQERSIQIINMDSGRNDAGETGTDTSDDEKTACNEQLVADMERTADNELTEMSKEEANDDEESREEENDETKMKEKRPPLTRDEIEAMKKDLVEAVQTHIDKMKDVEWTDENGKYVEGAKKLLYSFSFSYFGLKRAPLADRIESRRQIASVILKTDIIKKICDVVIDIYPKGWANEEKKTDLTVWKPLSNAFLFIHNFTDASGEFSERVANTPGFLEILHRILAESIEKHLKQDQPVNRGKVMKWTLSTVHNISMAEATIPRLRSLNFTEVLEPYLQSPSKMYQLNCLASLASIIDEKESEILNADNSSVKFLLKVLRKGLGNSTRRYNGWSCKECALTVKMLARNDTNKKLLVELGALELLVELAKGSIEEQIEAVGAIWALSFDEENRKIMVEKEELGVVSTLLNLKTVDSAKIKAAANGALWNLRENLVKSEKYHDLGEHISSGSKQKNSAAPEEVPDEEAGHIMISYQWASQKTLIEVRDSLIANGLKVWMDIDQMGGSTLQAMADAVEKASIVLIAMSHKYKDSPNCRAEAEYAFQKRKKIVPLMVERGYKPDGWLGFILGAKLFYDFSGKYPFQNKFNELLRELRRIKGQKESVQKEVIVPEKAMPKYHQPQGTDSTDSQHPITMAATGFDKMVSDVRKWTPDDVRNWVNKNDLPVQKFGHMAAGEIALLITMRREAPESFYKCLQETLKLVDLLTMSKLVWALNDIGR